MLLVISHVVFDIFSFTATTVTIYSSIICFVSPTNLHIIINPVLNRVLQAY